MAEDFSHVNITSPHPFHLSLPVLVTRHFLSVCGRFHSRCQGTKKAYVKIPLIFTAFEILIKYTRGKNGNSM